VPRPSAPSPVQSRPGHNPRLSPEAGRAPGDARVAMQTSSVLAALGSMMGDAPLCDVCGHITVRNGSCYRCLNCGNSIGCS
jgi:ribonucleoside-diphosphate reductase alpha chain